MQLNVYDKKNVTIDICFQNSLQVNFCYKSNTLKPGFSPLLVARLTSHMQRHLHVTSSSHFLIFAILPGRNEIYQEKDITCTVWKFTHRLMKSARFTTELLGA